MFDANRILGMLMDSGMSRSGQSRLQRVAAGSGQGADSSGQSSGGGLAGMARSFFGGGGRSSSSDRSAGGSGGLAGMASSLLGGGSTGSATSRGGMGLLGALAGAAMQHFGTGSGTAQASSGQPGGGGATREGLAEAPTPYGGAAAGADQDGRAMLMIRAMITAAKADGEIDPQERQQILGRLEQGGADPEAQRFVRDEMAKPADMNAIVSAVDSPQAAIEVYTASLFAIDVDTPREKQYLRDLAQALNLDPTMVRELHASVEAPQPN